MEGRVDDPDSLAAELSRARENSVMVMSEDEVYEAMGSRFGEEARKVVRDIFTRKAHEFNDGDRVIDIAAHKPLYVPGRDNYVFINTTSEKRNFRTGAVVLETLRDIAKSKGYDKPIRLEGDFLDVEHEDYPEFMNLVLNVEHARRAMYGVSIEGPARMVQACEQLKDKFGEGAYDVVRGIYDVTDVTLEKAREVVSLADKHGVEIAGAYRKP